MKICIVWTVLAIGALSSTGSGKSVDKAPRECLLPVNVAILVDVTYFKSNYESRGLRKVNTFIKKLSKYLGRYHNQLGVVEYDEFAAYLIAVANDGRHRKRFTSSIKNLPYPLFQFRKPARIDIAIHLAMSRIFARHSDLPKVLVMIATGKQTSQDHGYNLKPFLKILSRQSVHTLIVSVSKDADGQQLKDFVAEDGDVVTSEFKTLPSSALNISRHICTLSAPAICLHKADIVFLVQTNENLHGRNGIYIKDFIISLAHDLNVGPHGSRASVIGFREKPKLSVCFNETWTINDFSAAVRNLSDVRRLYGRYSFVRLDRAISLAFKEFTDGHHPGNPSFPKVLIIISDQRHFSSIYAMPLYRAIRPLRQAGVVVYGVGVGARRRDDLKVLAQKKENLFFRHSFHDLTRLSGKVIKTVCASIAPTRCSKSIDIVFILESSSSTSENLFHVIKQFIKQFASNFLMSRHHVQLGVITFDEGPSFSIKLGQYSTINGFIRRIENLKLQSSKKWRASSALRLAMDDLFSLHSGSRPGVKKVAVLFVTSGITSMVRSPLPKSDFLRLMIVALGSHSTNPLLGDFVEEEGDLTIVGGVDQVDSQARRLGQWVCDITDFPVLPGPLDLIFVIDCSRSIGPKHFPKQNNFLKSFLDKLPIGPHKTRIGVVVYSYTASVVIKLNDYYKTEDLSKAIDNIPFQGRSARFSEAFTTITRQLMKEANGRRKFVPAVVVLFTGELESQQYLIKNFSSSLRKKNLALIPVTIGHQVKKHTLDASIAQDLLTAPSFGRLGDILPSMWVKIAKIITEPPLCNFPVQLLFVVDSSGGFTGSDFERVKHFLKTVAITLNVGINTHIGVISYGSYVSNQVPLGQHRNAFEFSENLDEVVNEPGTNTSLVEALGGVPKAFEMDDRKQSAFTSRKMCVVINKGMQEHSIDSIGDAMTTLENQNIKVLAVVVGGYSNDMGHFKGIFNDSHDVIVTDSIMGLDSLMYPLTKQICKSDEKASFENNHCDSLADVAFLIDSAVNYDNYQKQLTFIKRLATRLNVSPAFTRAALVAYSDYGRLLMSLQDNQSYRDFERTVDRLSYDKGRQRRLDRALTFVKMTVFTKTGRERKFAPKVVVAIITGQQSVSKSHLRSSVKELDEAGINVFLVGFGKGASTKDLQAVAKSPSRVIGVAETWFDVLGLYADKTAACICKVIKPKACLHPMDVVFLMDSSGSVGQHNFEMEKKTINMLARTLNMVNGAARVAVVSFSNTAQVHLPFRKSVLPRQWDETIRRIRYSGFTTYIDLALHTLNNRLFKEEHGSRPYVPHTIVLLTDDKKILYSDYTTLNGPFRELRKNNINLITVGIGQYQNIPVPLQLADSQDVFRISSFDGLLSAVYPLSNRLCQLAAIQRCHFPVQLTFIISSSGIISKQTFYDIKEFIKGVSSKFTISHLESTANVNIHYADKFISFDAHQFSSNEDFYMAVDGIPYIAEPLQLEQSLFFITGLLTEGFDTRPEVPKAVVLLVHGLPGESLDPSMLRDVVSPLLGNKIKVIVVGIGTDHEVNHRVLRPLVLKDSDVIIPRSYQELYWRAGQVSRSICKAFDGEPCLDKVFDIGFLIDASSHITPSEFIKVKTFVKLIAQLFILEYYTTRIALILYSSKASLVYKLNSHLNERSLEKIIDELSFKGGSNRLDKAMDLVLAEFIRVDEEERRNVEKVLVYIVNGGLTLSLGVNTLFEAASPLMSLGVRSFVVSVKGSERTDRILSSVLGGEYGQLYPVPNYEQVNSKVLSVAKDICEIAEFPPCGAIADLCFMIDSSGSVGSRNFQRMKTLVKRLIKAFPVSSQDAHVSVITFSGEARLDIKLTDDRHDSLTDLERAIDGISYMGYVTRIDKALKLASREVFSYRGRYRPAMPQIAVLFMDGKQTIESDSVPLWEAVRLLKERGVDIYVVGIGSTLRKWELQLLASSPYHLLMVESFDDLMVHAKTLSRLICGEHFEGNHKLQK